MTFEDAYEIGRIGKSHLSGNLPHAFLRLQQEFLCMLHLSLLHILYGGDAHHLSEAAYEIRFREAGTVSKLLHADGLVQMLLDVFKDRGNPRIMELRTFPAVLYEIGKEDSCQSTELHALVIGHDHKRLHIIAICLMVQKFFGASRRQVQLGIEHAIVLKQQARSMVCLHLKGQFITVEKRSPLLRQQEYEKVIEGKAGLTVVGMGLIGRDKIKMSRQCLHIPVTEMEYSTPLLHAEQTQEGR